MAKNDAFVKHLKQEQQKLRDQLSPLESGSMQIRRRPFGGRWEDMTKTEIGRLKKSIAEYDVLIAQYSA